MFRLELEKPQITLIDRKGAKQTIDIDSIDRITCRPVRTGGSWLFLKNGTSISVNSNANRIADLVEVLTGKRPTVYES